MKKLPGILALLFLFPILSFSQWTALESGTTKTLHSVDFINPNSGWIVGSSDIIKQSKNGGVSWELYNGQLFPINRNWYDISLVNENEAYVCGNYYLDWYEAWWTYTINGGTSWIRPPGGTFVPNTSKWTSVFFLNENLGWRVGFRNSVGKVSKTTSGVGNDWGTSNLGTNSLYDVMFINETDGWIVGASGTIYHSDDGGDNWILQNSETSKSLTSVHFTDHLTGWAVGHQGNQSVILSTRNGGDLWTSYNPSNISELHAVYFIDEKEGWACGKMIVGMIEKGVIIHTENGGGSWDVDYIDDNCSVLYDMDFVDGVGYAVGSSGVLLKNIFSDEFLRFKTLSDMNNKKFGFGYTCDGEYIYTVGGHRPSPWGPWISTDIDRYNIKNNSWSTIFEELIPRRFCSAEYVPSQNKIYIFNGDTYDTDTYTNIVEIFDVVTGKITSLETNPNPVEYGGSAMWNNKIYLFGGSNANGYSKQFYEFDPETEIWTPLPDMPEPKQTNGEIIDGVLYVFGGYNHFTSKKIHAYDIQNKSWSRLEDLPFGISAHATAKTGKNIWLIGSYDNLSYIAVYNTDRQEFTQFYSDMIGRRHCGAATDDDYLYVFGGNQSTSYETIINSTQKVEIPAIVNTQEWTYGVYNIQKKAYPNPFTSQITFEFELAQRGAIHFKVFDCYGKEVENRKYFLEAGNRQLLWEAKGLIPGIYFYQIKSGTQFFAGSLLKVE